MRVYFNKIQITHLDEPLLTHSVVVEKIDIVEVKQSLKYDLKLSIALPFKIIKSQHGLSLIVDHFSSGQLVINIS